jgi:hypothetical protein
MPRAATGYGPLLRTPGAAAFFLAATTGRVGIAMTGLGLVWLLHDRTGSYATAGLAAAGFALAEALIGPQLARLIDRFGQTRVLPYYLVAHGAAVVGVLTSTTPAAAILAATCAGAAVPQLGALSGARWAHLLRGERADELPSAFSLESLANATGFLLGPVLVTALGAAGNTTLASGGAAVLILGGGAALAAQRRTAPAPARESVERARAERSSLLRPAFLLLALLNLAMGSTSEPWASRSPPSRSATGCPERPHRSSPPPASVGCSPAGSTACGGTLRRRAASSSSPPHT